MPQKKQTYTVQELAGELGMSTSTLRAWERRYALLSPGRTVGGHRLYSRDDLVLIQYIAHQRDEGWDLKALAAQGRAALLERARHEFRANEPQRTVGSGAENAKAPALAAERGGASARASIIAALKDEDLEEAAERLERIFSASPSAATFADHAAQIMRDVWQARHKGVITRTAAQYATRRLRHILLGVLFASNRWSQSAQHPLAVVAGIPGEQHEIDLLRVALHLRIWNFRITYLGSDVPTDDLLAHVRVAKPALLCLSAWGTPDATKAAAETARLDAELPAGLLCVVGGASASGLGRAAKEWKRLRACDTLEALAAAAKEVFPGTGRASIR